MWHKLSSLAIKTAAASRQLIKLDARQLTHNETILAKSVFADALDTSSIKLVEHWLVLPGYAISPNGHIYFHRGELVDDFSKAPLNLRSWFVHELTHVWQVQQGMHIIRRALIDRRYHYSLKKGKDFFSFGIEQQAQMVQDFYEKRERGEDCQALMNCIPFLKPPEHQQTTGNLS